MCGHYLFQLRLVEKMPVWSYLIFQEKVKFEFYMKLGDFSNKILQQD